MTAPQTSLVDSSLVVAGINAAIEQVERHLNEWEAITPETSRGPHAGTPAPDAPYSLEDLEMLLVRLQQIKTWFQQDPRLLPIVDDHISAQVRKHAGIQARQNLILAASTTVVGAVLGWLLSSLVPATALVQIIRH
jgi:hypothetical protein